MDGGCYRMLECVFSFFLGMSYGYVSVSCLCLSLSRFAVFWVDTQFFFVADTPLFVMDIQFFAAVVPLTWKVCTI